MEKFECNACGREKQKSSFYRCQNCKDEIMKEMVQTLANLNMVEVLIQVYQG